ncbi:hypothetical protein [Pedobacter sp. GR22-6]|uniref:hypothetical protein n=1 Tax=Pedobacter sp. GR22-6 TaxID=3127957 RepID=UPI00307EBF76
MKSLLTLSLVIYFSFATYAQSGMQRFLVAEYRIDSLQVGNYTYLTSYNFKNGKFIGKDTLLQQPKFRAEDKTMRINYNVADKVYKNKYLLTKYGGNVIDLKTRKILYKLEDVFIEALGDTLIYYCNSSLRGTGYRWLNLKTGAYTKIEDKSWYTPRYSSISPDKKHFLSVDRSAKSYKLLLNDFKGSSKVVVKDGKSGALSKNMTQLPSIESYWLNNDEFLYAVHHIRVTKPDIIHYKVELRKYKLSDSSDRLTYTLDSIPQGYRNGYFHKTEIGEVYYTAVSGQSYLLDTLRLTLSAIKEFKLAHGFSVIYGKEDLFKYKGKEIGLKNVGESRTAEGLLAARFGGYIGDPKGYLGVMFWSAKTKEWLSFDIPWINTIIGWWEE